MEVGVLGVERVLSWELCRSKDSGGADKVMDSDSKFDSAFYIRVAAAWHAMEYNRTFQVTRHHHNASIGSGEESTAVARYRKRLAARFYRLRPHWRIPAGNKESTIRPPSAGGGTSAATQSRRESTPFQKVPGKRSCGQRSERPPDMTTSSTRMSPWALLPCRLCRYVGGRACRIHAD